MSRRQRQESDAARTRPKESSPASIAALVPMALVDLALDEVPPGAQARAIEDVVEGTCALPAQRRRGRIGGVLEHPSMHHAKANSHSDRDRSSRGWYGGSSTPCSVLVSSRLLCSPRLCSSPLLESSPSLLVSSARPLCSPCLLGRFRSRAHRSSRSARLICSPHLLTSSARLVCSPRLLVSARLKSWLTSSARLICSRLLSSPRLVCSPRLLASSACLVSSSARLVCSHLLASSAAASRCPASLATRTFPTFGTSPIHPITIIRP